MKKSSDFKNLKSKNYGTIKLKGLYEHKLRPIELILNISFSVIPTKKSLKNLSKEEFSNKLKKRISLINIEKSCFKLNTNWKFDGARFTYEHNLECIKLKKNCISSLGIDLYYIQKNTKSDIHKFYNEICEKISKIKPFRSTNYFLLRQDRNE